MANNNQLMLYFACGMQRFVVVCQGHKILSTQHSQHNSNNNNNAEEK